MRKSYYQSIVVSFIFLVVSVLIFTGSAFATFSIVAVDTLTGEIGSAGMSCSPGVADVCDIVEGVGGINTQSWYLVANQNNAHDRMVEGMTPSEIITWLETNDAGADPHIRQYGVVTLAGPGASAAYSGILNYQWNGHVTGPGYAIQGNRLLGPEIVESMETAFLTTEGELADRLLEALEASNVPGADMECLSCDKPGISAFIKVVRPGDGGSPYLYENVNNTICTVNPMDGLRDLYNSWKARKVADPDLSTLSVPQTYFLANFSTSTSITVTPRNSEDNPPTDGSEVALVNSGEGVISDAIDNGDGSFSATMSILASAGVDTITAYITAGGQVVELNQNPVLHYLNCGDANADNDTNIGDAVFLINYIFNAGEPPILDQAGDANCDGGTNIGDAVYLINYIFNAGAQPCEGCE